MNEIDFDKFKNGILNLWMPNDEITLTQWCEENVVLPSGPFRARPYQVELLNSMLESEFTFCLKSARIGYTQMSSMGNYFFAHQKGRPQRQLLVFPTIQDCDGHSKTELQSICLDNNSDVFTSNTVRSKIYPGGNLLLIGANSESALRRISIDRLWIDELSAVKTNENISGDLYSLALKRAESSNSRGVVVGSTPGQQDHCRMTELFHTGSEEYFGAPCLICNEWHTLSWEQMRHLTDEDEEITHQCPHCEYEMPHVSKFEWMEQASARWVADKPEVTIRSFFIWSAFSYDKNCTWEDIKTEYRQSLVDDQRMNVFKNTFLGQTYEPTFQQVKWDHFMAKRINVSTEPGFVPPGVQVLYGGIDVQKDRFEFSVMGFSKDTETKHIKWHLIDHIVVDTDGDVFDPQNWDYLKDSLNKPYYSEDGKDSFKVRRWALDSGYASSMCYNFARSQRNVSCIKGSSTIDRDIETKPRRIVYMKNKHTPLYIIGVHRLKIQVIAEIQNASRSSFPAFESDYFRQLFSEKLVVLDGKEKFVKTQRENEVFDCCIYANFIANVDQVKRRLK